MPSWFGKKPAESDSPKPARPAALVRVAELVREDTVLIDPPAADKEALLDLLVALVCKAHDLPDAQALGAKVREREAGISTTLDTGLSLPHARVDGLSHLCAGLALLPKGLPDPLQPAMTIRAMFLFFSPNKSEAFPLHLQVLRGVATLFQPKTLEELLGARSAAEAIALMRSRET